MSLSKTIIRWIIIWSTIYICSVIISRIILTNFCIIGNLSSCKVFWNLHLKNKGIISIRKDCLSQCLCNFSTSNIRPSRIIKLKSSRQIISNFNILCLFISLVIQSNFKTQTFSSKISRLWIKNLLGQSKIILCFWSLRSNCKVYSIMIILIRCIRTSLSLSKLSIPGHQMSSSKTVIIYIRIWSTIYICSIIISSIILTNFCQVSNLPTCKIRWNLSLQSYSNWLPRCDLLSQCFYNFSSSSIRPTCIIKFKPI